MSENINKPIKVLLDAKAAGSLLQMIEEVKALEEGDFVQITTSKLVSWIISRYRQSSFKRDKAAIKRAHFNYQKQLKEALKSVSDEEELRVALSSVMKQVGRGCKSKKQGLSSQ